MIELMEQELTYGPKILVIGVGGGGNNAVNRMIDAKLKGVTFAVVNTDAAVLYRSQAEIKIQIGEKLLHGYGAGADPTLGEAAAKESEEEIKKLVQDYNMVIITCGMGGGTGTGAAPIIARCSKSEGILTMGVVTLPFSFENRPRMSAAQNGVEQLKDNVDTLLVIPNDKLLAIVERQLNLKDAFTMADTILKYTIEGVTNIVYNLGEINLDFHDLRTTLIDKGIGHLGIGTVDADGSILDAVKEAVNSPLLETNIVGAENILLNTSGNITLTSLNEAADYIRELAGENVNMIWGTVSDEESMKDKITVTLIATGMPEEKVNVKKESRKEVKIEDKTKEIFEKSQKAKEEMQVQIPVFLKNYSEGTQNLRQL
ncbi:MAG: cell division protein FtsZ [Lachnospiraceae bacterium]|nr:cell division protein FtsZ [Lachnospiraceae bacterium]